MTKLNQIIAIEKGIKSRSHSEISELNKLIQKPQLFTGGVRFYQKKDEDGEDLPQERQHVQFKSDDVLANARQAISDLVNVTLQKDEANMNAKADVRVDDAVIMQGVPVTTLLFLEKQLTDMKTFISNLPVLDSAENWSKDEGSGLYKTETRQTQRTKKVQRPIVLYEATDKHPAQTQMITDDVTVGQWNTVMHSSAVPFPKKQEMQERIEKLILAVKQAREEANDIEVSERRPLGQAIFDYLGIGG